ncbi:uncharacterized protein LOC143237930 [Tachypleus tridentatus]|uniref:uncharacterized protein LOC143237930 n=1 Tax=Tachypleus tridentatus TaxID=6853 RepID=UPI003FD18CE0
MPELIVDGINITNLTDDELFVWLKDAGVDVGPIIGSTRAVYERKLARLLQNKYQEEMSQENTDENVSDDEQQQNNQSSVVCDRTRDWTNELRRRPLASAHSPCSENLQSGLLHGLRRLDDRIYSSSHLRSSRNLDQFLPKASQQTSVSLFVKLVIFSVLFILVFLVYQNMESSVSTSIPGINANT